MLLKLVLSGMMAGKARVACAIAGVATAVGALLFTSSLSATNSLQAPLAAEKAARPWAAWCVDGIRMMPRRGDAKAPPRVKSNPPSGAKVVLKTVALSVDLRIGGRVLQGPPVRVLLSLSPSSLPYENVALEEGRWVDETSSEMEVVCLKNALKRSSRGEAPPLGARVKFVGAKGTMTAKIVGYLGGGKLPRSFPSVFANSKAFNALSGENIGRVFFYDKVPCEGDVLTPYSDSVIESFKGDSQRHMDYAKPLLVIAAFLTALALLVNSQLLSVEANRRELAKLRTAGLTRKGLILFTTIEAFISAFVGWLVGLVVSLLSLAAYVSIYAENFPSGMAIDFSRVYLSLFLLPLVVFLSVLFALFPVLRVRALDAFSERPRPVRRGMVLAYGCGFAAFVAVEVWGASLMRAFVPSPEWPDAIVSLLPSGVSSFDVEKIQDIKGVKRISELVPRQVNLHLPKSGGKAENVLFLASQFLPEFKFAEGDYLTAQKSLLSGRGVVIDLMLSRHLNLHVGDTLSVSKPFRRGGKAEVLSFPIVAVADVNWHMVTSRGLVRGLNGASPMTSGPVFCSYDTIGEVDFSTYMTDPSFSAPMTHLWVDYDKDFLEEHGVFKAGRIIEGEIARRLGNPVQATVRLHARDEIADGTLARGSNVIGQAARVPFVFLVVLAIGFVAMLVAEADGRRKEFAVLRAVGATTTQIAFRLTASAFKTALLGVAGALPVGSAVGWYFAGVTASRWPGMPHYFVVPWEIVLEGAAGAVVFALLFAIPSSLKLVKSSRGK
jgi:ABC-type lipoprotein release transport system permease subunit